MIRLAYNLALLTGVGLGSPFLAAHAWRGRSRAIARARLGLAPGWLPAPGVRGGIWLHALSVGEFLSALPLIQALLDAYPDRALQVSLSTAQGLETARRRLEGRAGVHLLVRTLDLPWLVERTVETMAPALFILVEGDVWPNLQWSLGRRGVPRMLVNARLSPRSYGRFRLAPWAARAMLGEFELILAQSEADRERLAGLGLDPARLEMGGNLKFDAAGEPPSQEESARLASQWNLSGRPVLAAGSTHAGEEQACLEAYTELARDFTGLALILAPRDTRRGGEVLELARGLGLRAHRLSQGAPPEDCAVLILDEMGFLARAYGLAQAAFVGGSLVAQGGHNPLEPAVAGVPVAFGPHMDDFAGVAQGLEQAGAATVVRDAAELTAVWRAWLADEALARQVGQAGAELCRSGRGAVDLAVRRAGELLAAPQGAPRA